VYSDGKTVFEKPVHNKIPNNVATKCDFCYHLLEKGESPKCAEICPTSARIVGDLSDSRSKIVELIEKYKAWTLLPEKGTAPRVYYIG
jgi:Fe-S-cluster-containing dehydrogenase component